MLLKLLISLNSVLFLLIGCEPFDRPQWESPEIIWNVDTRLSKDSNDYYHLTLDVTRWQTLHRFSGSVVMKEGKSPIEGNRFEWESSHYWYLGDTLGYIVKRGLTDNLEYVSYDTVYVTGFNGMEVPTINPASYSNSGGEFNQMFGPVRSMRGDTVKVTVAHIDYYGDMTGIDFYVILD
ncbi:MAG: hypothetical protein H8E03_00880 [Pelagibacteraceae bacterium]|nr:hypothetical protein [Pelagibacteraceae bacterium]